MHTTIAEPIRTTPNSIQGLFNVCGKYAMVCSPDNLEAHTNTDTGPFEIWVTRTSGMVNIYVTHNENNCKPAIFNFAIYCIWVNFLTSVQLGVMRTEK